MSTLVRKLLDTLQTVEEEIHHKEEFLKMRSDGYEAIEDRIIKILKRDELTNDEKVET